jgi:hypothetical protein
LTFYCRLVPCLALKRAYQRIRASACRIAAYQQIRLKHMIHNFASLKLITSML